MPRSCSSRTHGSGREQFRLQQVTQTARTAEGRSRSSARRERREEETRTGSWAAGAGACRTLASPPAGGALPQRAPGELRVREVPGWGAGHGARSSESPSQLQAASGAPLLPASRWPFRACLHLHTQTQRGRLLAPDSGGPGAEPDLTFHLPARNGNVCLSKPLTFRGGLLSSQKIKN